MESLNRMAIELVDEAIDFADELAIDVYHLDNDGVVLDFGVKANGGIEAGLLLTEIQTAGLATVQTRMGELDGPPIPFVELSTDHPLLSLLCSQKAGWRLTTSGFSGYGSGPARLFVEDGPEFEYVDYRDDFDLTALSIEAPSLPDEAVVEAVAERVGVPMSGVYLPTAPAASVAGTVAAAARAAEVAVLRLMILGYDPRDIVTVAATAPVPPIAGDERTAIARANDAIAYAGRVHLVLAEDVDDPDAIPFAATRAAGRSFADILDAAEWNFAEVEDVFAPAQATLSVVKGRTYTVGAIDTGRLADQWF